MASISPLNDVLVKIITTEGPKLNNICYAPSITVYERDLRQYHQVQPFTQYPNYKMLQVPVVNILLRLYQSVSDIETSRNILVVLGMHIYGALMRKHFGFCDSTRMQYALDRVKSSNMLKRYGAFKAIIHWSNQMLNKFGVQLASDKKVVLLYIYYRTAISQSIKSISAQYYQFDPDAIAREEKATEFVHHLAQLIIQRISMDGIDERILNQSIDKVHINKDIGTEAIEACVRNEKFLNDLLVLMLIGVKDKTDICQVKWWLSLRKRGLVYNKNPLHILLTRQALLILNVDVREDEIPTVPKQQEVMVQQIRLLILLYFYDYICSLLCG